MKVMEIITKLIMAIKNPNLLVYFFLNLKIFRLVPDSLFLRIHYRIRTREQLNLNDPQSFNEKLQWLKLHDKNSNYPKLVDKYEVKKIVKDVIGKEHVIKNYGVWNSFDEIDFELLPSNFVLKCTHDSGTVVICRDKKQFDFSQAKAKLEKSLKRNYYYWGREWPYKTIKPRILAEELLVDSSLDELRDYKIYCFNGDPKIIQVISERIDHEFTVDYFDLNWQHLELSRVKRMTSELDIKKPENLAEMLQMSKELSQEIPFVRVDLYSVNQAIYFGELTFYPASGCVDFKNKENDYMLGKWLVLPK